MRNSLVLNISRVLQTINAWMIKRHVIAPSIVVPVDGGICSQISEWLHGQYYAEVGIKVEYDFSWFLINGKDTYGQHDRPNELFAFFAYFPNLRIQEVSRLKAWWYSLFMKSVNPNAEMPNRDSVRQSMYLNPYVEYKDNQWVAEAFKRYFPIKKVDMSSIPTLVVGSVDTCAIHVRRGDMSYVEFVGYDNPVEYFIDAVNYVINKYGEIKFFIFSDEHDWTKEKLLPLLNSMDIEVINGNEGYVDLLLAAQCSIIIASQGTMGRMAGLLNPESELILPPTGNWGAYHVEKYRSVTQFPRPIARTN